MSNLSQQAAIFGAGLSKQKAYQVWMRDFAYLSERTELTNEQKIAIEKEKLIFLIKNIDGIDKRGLINKFLMRLAATPIKSTRRISDV